MISFTESECVEEEEGVPDTDLTDDGDADFSPGPPLVSSTVCQNLDRGETSKRAAFRTLAALAAERPLRRAQSSTRIEERKEAAETIRQEFQATTTAAVKFLTVHLDGIKVLTIDGKHVDGHDIVERLPVISYC